MASNTVSTVWRLIFDEGEARKGESMIQKLSRLLKEGLGKESTAAVDKTTEAIKNQTEALKENAKAAEGSQIGLGDAAGNVGGAAGKLRGLGSKLGGGEGLNIVNDIGDAVEGFQELGSTLVELGPIGAVAGVAMVALGVVIADFAAGAQKTADQINEAIDSMRSVADEIAGGATTEDIQNSIEQLQIRRDMEKDILAQSTQAYQDFIQGIRDAFGFLAPLVEGIVKIVDPREEALKTQIETSNKLIGESEAKENAYNKALDKGLTSKADAKQAAEEQAKAQEKATREAEKSAQEQKRANEKAQAEQDKAAADAQRAAEQLQAKRDAIQKKELDAAQKYGDALVDIARKSADDAAKALKDEKLKEIDNRRSFEQDISDMSADFQASEREEALSRMEEEANDLKHHADTLQGIRDDANAQEEDLLRSRDFLGATKVRENANKQLEAENKAFQDAQAEKLQVQRSEDAKQLRELDNARQKRLLVLRRANEEAQLQYRRDLDNQRDARKIAEREARIARDRELRQAQEMARALLGIQSQSAQAQLQLASNTLNQLRGISNTTNNNGNTVNGGLHFSVGGGSASGMTGTQIQGHVLAALGSVGLA